MSYTLENLKILIADDHFLIRQLLINILHARAVTSIDAAATGRAARDMINQAYIAKQPYDVIFLDWEMPDITGIDVLKYFREQHQFDKTAFVMVTAVMTQPQVKDAIRSGATAYITKPISSVVIDKKLDEIVQWLAEKRSPLK